jgi:hypothetical protein
VRYWRFPRVTGFVIFCLTAGIGFAGDLILGVDTVTFNILAPSGTGGQFFRDRAWEWVLKLVC